MEVKWNWLDINLKVVTAKTPGVITRTRKSRLYSLFTVSKLCLKWFQSHLWAKHLIH